VNQQATAYLDSLGKMAVRLVMELDAIQWSLGACAATYLP
jgi:hypothetical protein